MFIRLLLISILLQVSFSVTSLCSEINLSSVYYTVSTVYDVENHADTLWVATDGGVVKQLISGERLEYYTQRDGLGSNYVNSITIDDAGNKWFGTLDGATFFNGNSFVNYNRQNSNIIGDAIEEILIDDKGAIWFVTSTNGISVLNGSDWSHFTYLDGIASNVLTCATFDKDYNLWVGTGGFPTAGISVYNGTNWTNYTKSDGIADDHINSLDVDSAGNVWAGMRVGLSMFDGDSWTTFTRTENIILVYNPVSDITVAPNGNVWIATGEGVSEYDGVNWTDYVDESYPTDFRIRSICHDKNDDIWFSTFDGKVSKVADIPNGYNEYGSAYGAYSFLHLNNGNVVIGTSNGVAIYNPLLKTWKNVLLPDDFKSKTVFQLATDNDQNIWARTYRNILMLKDNKWVDYTEHIAPSNPNSLHINSEGIVYIGTTIGLVSFDGAEWSRFTLNDGLPGREVYGISSDSKGNLLLSHYGDYNSNKRFSKFNGSDFVDFSRGDSSFKSISSSYNSIDSTYRIPTFSKIVEDLDGSIWAKNSSGIYHLVDNKWSFYDSINSMPLHTVHDICIDAEGVKWIVANRSVYTFDGTNWEIFTVDKTHSTEIRSIAIDNNGAKRVTDYHSLSTFGDGGALPLQIDKAYVSVYAFWDKNQNGSREGDEPLLQNQLLKNEQDQAIFEIPTGHMNLSLPDGSYSYSILSNENWESTTPKTVAFEVQNSVSSSEVYFGFIPKAEAVDFTVRLSNTPIVPNSNVRYWCTVHNIGSQSGGATLDLIIPKGLEYQASSAIHAILHGDSVSISIDELKYFSKKTFTIDFKASDTLTVGDSIYNELSIQSFDTEPNLKNNSFTYTTVVELVTDEKSNYKVEQTGISSLKLTEKEDFITYSIGFQNTYSEQIYKLTIIDTLDNSINPKSFRYNGSSAACNYSLSASNILEISFDDISLPTIDSDSLNSCGYFSYSVKATEQLADSTTITNTAFIYYEGKDTVKTNSVQNTLVTIIDQDKDGVADEFDLFPFDPLEVADTDGDGVGNNADAFPNDPTETVDTDGDGYGDNVDVYPLDPSRYSDEIVKLFTNYTDKSDVSKLLLDQNYVWFASTKGLVKSTRQGEIIETYTNDYGLPSNSVLNISVAPGGEKWFSTNKGAAHLSGFSWETHTKAKGLANDYVQDIAQGINGDTWFATNAGLTVLTGDIYTTYSKSTGLVTNNFVTVRVDVNGIVWAGTYDYGLYKYDGTDWELFHPSNSGLLSWKVYGLEIDQNNTVWVSSDRGLVRFDGTDWQTEFTGNVSSFSVSSKNEIWVKSSCYAMSYFDGTDWTENTTGLDGICSRVVRYDQHDTAWLGTKEGIYKFYDNQWNFAFGISPFPYEGATEISASFDGNLNFVMSQTMTDKKNIVSHRDGEWSKYIPDSIASSYSYKSFAIDLDGTQWIGTTSGVMMYDGTTRKVLTKADGLAGNYVNKVFVDHHNNKWFATSTGLSMFDGNNWATYSTVDGLPADNIKTIQVDGEGTVWIGTSNKGIAKFDGVSWISYNDPNAPTSNYLQSMAIDKQNNIWIGTSSNGIMFFDGTTWKSFTTIDGLPDNNISGIAVDVNGIVWASTQYKGIVKFDGTDFTSYSDTDGLVDKTSYSIFIDSEGTKWVGTYLGISKLSDNGAPGVNHLAHIDTDNDGVVDIEDKCPKDPIKFEEGKCGCGVDESVCAQVEQIINIDENWNIVSLYVDLDDSRTETVFDTESARKFIIKDFNSFYNSSYPSSLNALKELTTGSAFFIMSDSEQEFTISGVKPDQVQVSLIVGWNLIGYPLQEDKSLEEVFTTEQMESIEQIKDFDLFYLKGSSFNTLTKFENGKGYLIKVTSPFTVEFNK